tara:strand:+ start:1081 stop:1320 length:240 start_codon:yes stop_codon:yes gene_type:complete
MIKIKKYIKLLTLSFLSLLAYIFIKNSEIITSNLLMIQHSRSTKAFGYYILLHISIWFLLVFGILGFVFCFFKIFLEKD